MALQDATLNHQVQLRASFSHVKTNLACDPGGSKGVGAGGGNYLPRNKLIDGEVYIICLCHAFSIGLFEFGFWFGAAQTPILEVWKVILEL